MTDPKSLWADAGAITNRMGETMNEYDNVCVRHGRRACGKCLEEQAVRDLDRIDERNSRTDEAFDAGAITDRMGETMISEEICKKCGQYYVPVHAVCPECGTVQPCCDAAARLARIRELAGKCDLEGLIAACRTHALFSRERRQVKKLEGLKREIEG